MTTKNLTAGDVITLLSNYPENTPVLIVDSTDSDGTFLISNVKNVIEIGSKKDNSLSLLITDKMVESDLVEEN